MLPPLLLLLLFVFPARASTVCDWRENSTNASICDGSFHGTKVVLSWGGYGLGEFPVNELGLSWAGTGKEADAPPIEGTLPTELGLLKHLEVLHLDHNALSGTIPTELLGLANLSALALNTNSLSGTLPPALGNLTSLTLLHLDNNNLTGTIPVELCKLDTLTHLNLRHNRLKAAKTKTGAKIGAQMVELAWFGTWNQDRCIMDMIRYENDLDWSAHG